MADPDKITLPAPAKVNLSLHVVGRRDDGYHELITRMQKLDLCDWLELQPGSGDIVLNCSDNSLPVDERNLAVRAAHRFFSAYRGSGPSGLKIRLEKRIPVAAGLGGGSSDAAAVLVGLNQLFERPFSDKELIALGRPLGADVPFFVSAAPAACATGIGDRLRPAVSCSGYCYILINPGLAVSTRWVYERLRMINRLTNKSNEFRLCGSQNSVEEHFCVEDLHNDLERVTEVHFPVIGQIKRKCIEFGAAGALMSGSGPTVFGLFAQELQAHQALQEMRREFLESDGHRMFLTRAYTGA